MSEMTHPQEEEKARLREMLGKEGLLGCLEHISAREEYRLLAEALTLQTHPHLSDSDRADYSRELAGQMREMDGFFSEEKAGVLFVSSQILDRLEADAEGLEWNSLTPPLPDQYDNPLIAEDRPRIEAAINDRLGSDMWRANAKAKAQSPNGFMRSEAAHLFTTEGEHPLTYYAVREEFSHDRTSPSAPAGGKFYLVALESEPAGIIR